MYMTVKQTAIRNPLETDISVHTYRLVSYIYSCKPVEQVSKCMY